MERGCQLSVDLFFFTFYSLVCNTDYTDKRYLSMLKSFTTRPQMLLRVSTKRWHSSSSWPPQTKDANSNSNGEVETTDASKEAQPSPVKSASKSSASTSSRSTKNGRSLKKPISVKSNASTITNSFAYVVTPPSVNSTQHLDQNALRNDIFYGGFRPVLTPLRRPVTKTKKTPTIPLSWNMSACKLETFDDYSKVPQFVVDKLVPFHSPQEPGNEIRLGAKSRKEQKEMERLSKDVYEFILQFRK
ncbi:CYFA0S12e04082g1_1 [Cyberlindnera fabianii]|uniref:CYFA0S12e04082g1_1 n=2 Tax=Cyberlindnera fabianii TaxID=36022 RepID=A0A061B1R8_CYBFA|nr:CYFA0S12e04082g1_1 [Cyberlindnera fabianii]